MAGIIPVTLDSRFLGGDSTFFDTNNYSPPPNANLILIATTIGQVSPIAVIPSLSTGNGITWSLVISQSFDWVGTDRGRVSVFRGIGAAPVPGTTRVQYADTQFRQFLNVFQFNNTDIGSLGLDFIAASNSLKEPSGSGINPSITMPPAENPANATLGILSIAEGTPLIVEGLGFTLLDINTQGGPELGTQAIEFSQVVKTTVDWNLSSDTLDRALVALELRNIQPFTEGVAPAVGGSAFVSGNLIT